MPESMTIKFQNDGEVRGVLMGIFSGGVRVGPYFKPKYNMHDFPVPFLLNLAFAF